MPHVMGLWNRATLLRDAFEPLVRLYVYFLVLLPSGNILGINVKVICFVLLLAPALEQLTRTTTTTLRHLSLLIVLPLLFTLWIIVSQLYGFSLKLALSQYRAVLIMFASTWIVTVYFSGSERKHLRFLTMTLHAEVAACVLKALILVYCAVSGVSVALAVNALSTYTGTNLMGMDFESALGRIQFVADGLIPLCLYMLLMYRSRLGISRRSAVIMFNLLIASLAFSFSRYFWAFGGLAIVVGLVLSKKDRFHLFLLLGFSVVLAFCLPFLIAIAQLRFSVDVAGGSDQPRVQQTAALKAFFQDAPLLGHGFGSYTYKVIRSDELPYVYEVEMLALAGQEGIVGLSLMSLLGAYYFHSLWREGRSRQGGRLRQRFGLATLLAFWIGSGLVNPSLFSSAAAISYATIKALAEVRDDREGLPGIETVGLAQG